ncbi:MULTISPECIES: LmeA family phospholipid-binding protein [Parafrankia]|uniref:LmeA family phospholipid-binding protein n=1 Tax=Parafrankia TaxID=2994362 RepID=UPI000B89C9B1|nr:MULTISPECIES: DUF2993 domain-containing protein [Parafrankia]MBE3202598.1 LmeA family phospholipid-binding protein [Parafrankia sp. CH37]
MNHGRGDDDAQDPADVTHVMPPGGPAGSEHGTRPTQDVQRRARPGAPSAPPPPAASFRPAGPPPPADAFRPGRPVRPADEGDQDDPAGGATQVLGDAVLGDAVLGDAVPGDATTVVRRGSVPRAAGGRPAAPEQSGPHAQPGLAPPGLGYDRRPAPGYNQPAPGQSQPGPGYDWSAPTPAPDRATTSFERPGPGYDRPAHTGGSYTDSGGHVRPVPGGGGFGEAGRGPAEADVLAGGLSAEQPPGGPGGGSGGDPGRGGQGDGAAAGPPARRKRRRGRVLTLVVVVLLVLFVVADRVAVAIAKDQMEKQIAESVAASLEPGDTQPTVRKVSIGGFPFLTQVLFGKFTNIGVTIDGIPTPGPRISSVNANLKGLHVPFKDAISDNIGEVPVDDVRATVRISYDDLNTYLAKQDPPTKVTPVDGGKKVEISASVAGQQVGGVTTFQVDENKLTLIPSEIKVLGFEIPLPGGVSIDSIPIPIAGLPFDLNIVQASTGADGLSLTATAKDVTLPAAPESTGGK